MFKDRLCWKESLNRSCYYSLMNGRILFFVVFFIFSSVAERVMAHETEDNKTVSITVDYKEERGTIIVNDQVLKSGQSLFVEYGGTVIVKVLPEKGHCCSLGSSLLMIPQRNISQSITDFDGLNAYNTEYIIYVFKDFNENMTFKYTFFRLYNASIEVRDGGNNEVDNYVKVDKVKSMHVGMHETSLRYIRNMELEFNHHEDYRLKQVLIDDKDMTNEIENNKLTLYDPPKNIIVEYAKALSVFMSYNEGGSVKLNDLSVPSGQSATVVASTDVKITIAPHIGYRIQHVKLGGEDVTNLVKDNVLMISSIAENKEINVVFEKIHNVKVTYSTGGNVMINNQSVTSGQSVTVIASTEVKITITPQNDYRIQRVKLGDNDVTNQLSNNILTIPSILSDEEISITFEKGAPITYAVKVTYSTGGSVKVNDQSVTSGQSATVTASADAKVTITPYSGYRIQKVELGGKDVTGKLSGNLLTISSIFEDNEIKITFVKTTYLLSITYSEGGYVMVSKNGWESKEFTSGQSATFRTSDIVDVFIETKTGYRVKQILLGNTDITDKGMITFKYSSFEEVTDKEITVIFEKITYTVKVTYSDGGSVKVNDQSVASGNTCAADISTDVKVTMIPNKGYRLRKVTLGFEDITYQVIDNVLTIPSISRNKEITIEFSYILKVYSKGHGNIKVNDEIIQSGSIVPDLDTGTKFEFIPDEGYYIANVTLNSKDITSELIDNSYTISSLSSQSSLPSYSSLSVTFKTLPTYELNIDMPGNLVSIEIGDKVITKPTIISDIKIGSSIFIKFQPSKYYEIEKVTLGDKDITAQIQNDSYTIESMMSNLTLKIEYVQKQYSLSIDIQGTDKIEISGKEMINGSSIIMDSGYNRIVISSEYYLIKQVLLDSKIISKGSVGYFEINMDCNKKLTIIAELREKREVSLTLDEPGTLATHLSEEDMKMVTDLNLSGKIDQRDFLVVNQMQSLYKLNLESASIGSYNNYPANTIPEKAFHNNKIIKRIYLPYSIEAIGKQAFLGSAISDFDGSAESYKYFTKIGEESFKDCQNLIYIPSLYNISVIEKGTFENCPNLTTVSSVLTNLKEIKDAAFRNCKNLSISLESGLERIGDYAFENVKGVNIPHWEETECELTHIGINAFKGCQESLFYWGRYPNLKELPCFEGCNRLLSITFPPNVKEISAGTFKGCTSLEYVMMNECIERIAENAFSDCGSITKLYVLSDKAPEISENSFSDFVYASAELFVYPDYLYFYRNHTVWGKFQHIKPWGYETYRNIEAVISEGGEVKVKCNNDTSFNDTFYRGINSVSYSTSSRVELMIIPEEGYLIESVLLNEKNITNTLDENNIFVISNLMVDSHFEVKFKKDNTTGIDMINTDKRVYLSGNNQLSLTGFPIGALAFVYDASGRMVKQIMISDSVEKISLPGRGVYFIRIDRESFKIVY